MTHDPDDQEGQDGSDAPPGSDSAEGADPAEGADSPGGAGPAEETDAAEARTAAEPPERTEPPEPPGSAGSTGSAAGSESGEPGEPAGSAGATGPAAAPGDHRFSEGQGFGDPYEGFDLDPPELAVDPDVVDPVDSRVVADTLDERNVAAEDVDAEELLDVGLSYVGINRYEQATETFERVARFAAVELLAQEAWVNKGAAHAELEEYDAAIGAYREALSIDDRSEHAATAETNLAYALWEAGRTEQALEHAERAVEIDPRFGEGWYNRGFFLLERGLAEDAATAFDNALRLGFRNADILEQKARAHEQLGEDERAEELVDEAEQIRERAEEELVE
jgi:Flp pilus assembly protein TadD